MVASLSLAADLAAGGSLDDALRACVTATRLGTLLGIPQAALQNVYYLPLMALAGCTSTSHMDSSVLGTEIETFQHLYEVYPTDEMAVLKVLLPAVGSGLPLGRRLAALGKMFANKALFDADPRAHCEVAQMLAERLGFDEEFQKGLLQVFERWDGRASQMVSGPKRSACPRGLRCWPTWPVPGRGSTTWKRLCVWSPIGRARHLIRRWPTHSPPTAATSWIP